jgi:dUTP pyrophosphatase
MTQIEVKVVNNSNNPLPEYSTEQSAGMDLRANISSPITVHPQERVLVSTGLHISLPEGYEAMVRPRSGLALKHGITVLNTPGCVDADYRGDIRVILINLDATTSFIVNPGDRIAQLIINKIERVSWIPVEVLDTTERSSGGFGHTGVS